MSFRKLVWLNILVAFVIANVLYWLIPIGGAISRAYKTSAVETWFRKIPPAYADTDPAWVRRHWMELNQIEAVYRSNIGWRHAAMAGQTLRVEGPYLQRRTENPPTPSPKQVYFFGGSSMWGVGADDAGTIPSLFASHTGIHSENFGEHGWVAHQSLLLLIQLLQSGHRPDLVVFYDGVNEMQKCRTELTPDAHERERQFEAVLRASSRPDSFAHFLAPVMALAQRVGGALGVRRGGPEWYECHRNPQKAEAIANLLLQDWQLAKQLVESHGGAFVGLLQPVAYFSRTRLDGLKLSEADRTQYAAIYPLLREKIARGGQFHDLSSVLDRDEAVYLDWCHLSRRGNERVAARIGEIVAPLGFRR